MSLPLIPKEQTTNETLVSIVLPVYNEAKILRELISQIQSVLREAGYSYEIIVVNDGSTDESSIVLEDLAQLDNHVRLLHFSRNFGHQAAVHAGLSHTKGDAVVIMDSDMQDSPSAITTFLAKWQEGYDVVYAVRIRRKENLLKRICFLSFYRLLNLISEISMPNDAGNFGLIDRRVVGHIIQLREQDKYFAGLRSWVGFRQIGIPVEREARYDNKPKVSFYGLIKLSRAAIFSFSPVPLTVFYGLAFVCLLAFIGCLIYVAHDKFIARVAIPGWTSLMIVATFFGFMNSLGIAVLGEYVLRIYQQVRERPLYIVDRKVNFTTPQS